MMTNFWSVKMVANLNVSNLKKSHCAHMAKYYDFFLEALVVMCTF